jgi:hypothetical protein
VPIPAGGSLQVAIGGATNAAAITALATSTLRVVQLSGDAFFNSAGASSAGGGGSGGTSSNYGAAFPAVGTAMGLTNGTNMIPWSATTTYGTTPAAIAVPAVNAFVTNTNPNGQATAANSTPVVGATGTISGGSTGTAGSPSATVVSVQGATSMTPIAANPGTLALWGLAASSQNVATATNGMLTMGEFNTTPTPIATGNSSPLQLDANGNLLVNIKSGGGSGGTASSFGSAFPSIGTAIGLTSGTNMVAWSATTNYGTSPAAIAVPAVNAFVTNTNVNGQATAANSSPVVGATGTISGGSTGTAGSPSATVVSVQGAASMTPLLANPGTLGTWGLAASTQNVATATNGMLSMGEFNTTPTTIATGNSSPLQLDASGNLLVNIKAGAGSGGTASTFGSAFPSTGTAIGLTSGTNMVAWSATTNYGTAPAAIAVPAVNAFVTNNNGNGQATMANSAPVTIASNQSNLPENLVQVGGSALALGQTTASASMPVVQASDKNISATPYPIGATAITASATGTTAATTATLAGSASVTTYICGFSIRANATAAATGNATVTGTISGTLNFTQWTAPNASGLGVSEQIFAPCVPASAANTAIAVVSAAPGTGGVVSSTAWGYRL